MPVGAQGTSPLEFNRRDFSAWLGGQLDEQDRQRRSSEFEQFLRTSDMTPEERQMARIQFQSPRLADILERTRRNREDAETRRQMQEDRQRSMAELLKARQDEAERVRQEKADAIKAGIEAHRGAIEGSAVPVDVPAQFAPGGAPVPGPASKQLGGAMSAMFGTMGIPLPQQATQAMGQQAATNAGMNNVQTNMIHQQDLAWMQKNAPDSPIMKNVMAQEQYVQIQEKMRGEADRRMKDFLARKDKEKAAADKKKANEEKIAANLAALQALWTAGGAEGEVGKVMQDEVRHGKDPGAVYDRFFGKDATKKVVEAEKKRLEEKRDFSAEKKDALARYTAEEEDALLAEWQKKHEGQKDAKLEKVEAARIKAQAKINAHKRIENEMKAPASTQKKGLDDKQKARRLELMKKHNDNTITHEEMDELDKLDQGV